MSYVKEVDITRVKEAFRAAQNLIAELEGEGVFALYQDPDSDADPSGDELDRMLRLQSEVAQMLLGQQLSRLERNS
ncbi:hypothetical protein [Paracoccus sphaerophysae]|uniref:Uncharacterized protein n=1 Tax=Paracoccus sphaerophysae TaxID=690417 RepID=A0A099EWM4_9RHOB|nr:hypothetical protein [Paracoccus sphaerophysae]KGJ02604.1 hypothetical protein IC63_14460 [Paracoccus sphaerophysae]